MKKGPPVRMLLKRVWWRLRRGCWAAVAAIVPRSWAARIVQWNTRALLTELEGVATDKLIELLLVVMDLAFAVMRDYRESNLGGFRGRYVLRTADGRVEASALFAPGKMSMRTTAVAERDVTVTFKSPAAFRRFLSSKEKDILESLMANEVEVDGNLNYVYKLGFMARHLLLRLGIG
jgi:hypothetical protein